MNWFINLSLKYIQNKEPGQKAVEAIIKLQQTLTQQRFTQPLVLNPLIAKSRVPYVQCNNS